MHYSFNINLQHVLTPVDDLQEGPISVETWWRLMF